MTRVVVSPGICGKTVTVEVVKVGKRRVRINITTNCEKVTKMGALSVNLDQWDAWKPQLESEVYKRASKCQIHVSCAVPMAILKAIEVEAGIALPRPVIVRFESLKQ